MTSLNDSSQAQLAEREAGWYWVRKLGWNNTLEDWVPAEWRPEHRSWRSTGFSGIPDSEIQQGARLSPPPENQSLASELEALRGERDEADRRAGAAERRLAYEVDARCGRDAWLRKAKEKWGVSSDCSFDLVWAEALKLKQQAGLPGTARLLESSWQAVFETWWAAQGQFCRAGGGEYEKTFAYRAWEACLAKDTSLES